MNNEKQVTGHKLQEWEESTFVTLVCGLKPLFAERRLLNADCCALCCLTVPLASGQAGLLPRRARKDGCMS
jgi:hypothetical protein